MGVFVCFASMHAFRAEQSLNDHELGLGKLYFKQKHVNAQTGLSNIWKAGWKPADAVSSVPAYGTVWECCQCRKNRLSDYLQFGNGPVPKSPVAGHVLMTWVLGGICFLRGLGWEEKRGDHIPNKDCFHHLSSPVKQTGWKRPWLFFFFFPLPSVRFKGEWSKCLLDKTFRCR